MRSTRIVLLVCLLIVSAAVPLMAQQAGPSVASSPYRSMVSIPKDGAGMLDDGERIWVYDSAYHRGFAISKTKTVDGAPERIGFGVN